MYSFTQFLPLVTFYLALYQFEDLQLNRLTKPKVGGDVEELVLVRL